MLMFVRFGTLRGGGSVSCDAECIFLNMNKNDPVVQNIRRREREYIYTSSTIIMK